MNLVLKNISLILYYVFGQYLPTQPHPGWTIGYAIRRELVKHIFNKCGSDIIVKRRAYFGKGTGISVGDRSQIGESSRIGAHTSIGNDVIMGPEVIIWTIGHSFDRTDIPINQQGATKIQPVIIGDDVWIGQRVIIMPGVTIGSHAVIGTASIVTKDVAAWSVVAGIPAHIIKMRK